MQNLPNSAQVEPEVLIVTAELEEEEQARLDAMREAFFPPERNFVAAHLTLFHAIPGHTKSKLYKLLEAGRPQLPLHITLPKLMRLGKGFAVAVKSATLSRLVVVWQSELADVLSPQDSQKKVTHITVQNKVAPAQARKDFDEAQASFVPRESFVTAFAVWRYDGGPWTFLRRFNA